MLAEFAGDLAEHLLGGLRLLGDPGVLAHAGDGQQVFHHADQPLRVIAHILEQLMLLFERQVGRSRMAEVEPMMEVSGVRMSCETERSRLARIFSRSLSMRNCSCCLILVVIVQVTSDTHSITKNVSG